MIQRQWRTELVAKRSVRVGTCEDVNKSRLHVICKDARTYLGGPTAIEAREHRRKVWMIILRGPYQSLLLERLARIQSVNLLSS